MQHEFNHARPTILWGPRELPLGQGKPGTTPTSASDLSTNAEDFSSCRSPTTEVEGEPLRVSGRPTLRGSTAGQCSPALWIFFYPAITHLWRPMPAKCTTAAPFLASEVVPGSPVSQHSCTNTGLVALEPQKQRAKQRQWHWRSAAEAAACKCAAAGPCLASIGVPDQLTLC